MGVLREIIIKSTSSSPLQKFDWSTTSLGPSSAWNEVLRLWVRFISSTAQPSLLLWGKDHTLIFNDAFATVIGSKYEELMGRNYPEVATPILPLVSRYIEDGLNGRSGMFEDVALPSLNSELSDVGYYSFAYTPIYESDTDAEPAGLIGVLTDRTEIVKRKLSVQRELGGLHEIYERAPGFIALVEGPHHTFTFANASYRQLVGHREIIGKTVAEALPEVVGQGFVRLLDSVYQTGTPYVGRGIPIKLQLLADAGSELRYLDYIYHPVRDELGKIEGIFIEGHDVTDQVEAQARASELQSELTQTARATAMQSFASFVAHEVNQPLAAANNYLGVAKRLARGPNEQPVLLETLSKASDAMLTAGDIIRRLRTLTSTGSIRAVPTQLSESIRDAIALIQLGNPSLAVTCNIAPIPPVQGDSVHLQQVLVNLLRNASESMKDTESPQVEVTVVRDGEFAKTTIADKGGGVPEELLKHVFDWSVTTKIDGNGLGLPISQSIVEAHGGKIWAANHEAGAAFSFILPLAI